jgi:hypothetical protein
MSSVRWSIEVADELDKALKAWLGQHEGGDEALSRFVEEAVEARLFELTVSEVKERNLSYAQEEILQCIDEAQTRR